MNKILIVILVLLTIGSISYMNLAYADLWTDSFDIFTNYEELYLNLRVDYDILSSDYDDLSSEYESLSSDYDILSSTHDDLSSEYESLSSDYDILSSTHDDLSSKYDRLYFTYNRLSSVHDKLQDESRLKTTISGTNIHWDFYDSKGNSYSWTMPIRTFEGYVEDNAYHTYQQTHVNPYRLNLDGKIVTILNLDGFLQRSFSDVIDSVYDNSYNSEDFIKEVWYIVSQMTVYDKDTDERSEGRYALETFTRTGGDCEDLTILIADMLMSSSHTKNWTFEYVIFDSDNPTNPQDINRVALYIDNGQDYYYIESTAPPDFNYYPRDIVGWYYPVV